MERLDHRWGIPMMAVGVALALGACGSSVPRAVAPPPTSATTRPTTATTLPTASTPVQVVQASGSRTVLSPIGMNVRAQPAGSAKVLGTAAQGAVLAVLGHTTQAGGWYQVKGATVTGWISDRDSLSAQGMFQPFSSSQFGALYPSTWTSKQSTPNVVTLTSPTAGENIVVESAPSVSKLAAGGSGYVQTQSEVIVACGITTDLHIYTEMTAPATTAAGAVTSHYLAQIRIALDPKHALGVDASLGDLSELPTVRDFIDSVSFPFPQCQG